MRHPELPDEQLIEVPEEAVPHHVRSGWQRVDQAVAEAAQAQRDAQFSQPEPGDDFTDELAEARRREALSETSPETSEPAEGAEPAAPKRRRRTADTE